MLTKSILTATAIALVASVLIVSGTISVAAQGKRTQVFFAHLSGDEEVPSVDTNAQGVVILRSTDEFGLFNVMVFDYRLIVNNIENVFAAHIHCAPAGVNGPVGVTLFSEPTNSGPVNGVLVQDSFIAPNVGNGCGWLNLDDVLDAVEADGAYVNVHTLPGVPSGEIRGQLIDRRR